MTNLKTTGVIDLLGLINLRTRLMPFLMFFTVEITLLENVSVLFSVNLEQNLI
jgi:hypothetical protein